MPGIARAWVKPNSGDINHVVVYVAAATASCPIARCWMRCGSI
ncbi:hypothetical protein J4530_08840 [Neisseria subflava]|nr:hypothetical protein [Neisseria subflava]